MATKLEATSKNGTLSINQQTIIQREKFGQRFHSGLGVASSNASTLFSSSPIGGDSGSPPRNGSEDRNSLYTDDSSNVYDAFESVVDPIYGEQKNGFGFIGTDVAYLNYDHPNNPFFNTTDYAELIDGSANETERAYAGHPYLVVPEDGLDSPSILNGTAHDVELSLTPNVNYGHTTAEYRQQISSLTMLGIHVEEGEGNGLQTNENLGKYFKTNY